MSAKPDAHAVFETYLTQADNFLAASKKLKAAYGDKKREPDDISDARGSGIDAYNAMIEVSNSLRELEGNGLLK